MKGRNSVLTFALNLGVSVVSRCRTVGLVRLICVETVISRSVALAATEWNKKRQISQNSSTFWEIHNFVYASSWLAEHKCW